MSKREHAPRRGPGESKDTSSEPVREPPEHEGLADPRELVDSGGPTPPIVQPEEHATDEPLPEPGAPGKKEDREGSSS